MQVKMKAMMEKVEIKLHVRLLDKVNKIEIHNNLCPWNNHELDFLKRFGRTPI